MNEFNIITTYYNNKDLLLKFCQGFAEQKLKLPFLKLYIIDDGSKEYPAESFLTQQEDIHLYVVTEDLGFNSHGCRNLGMMESDKDWNLLIDSDVNVGSLRLDRFVNWYFESEDVVEISINSLFIHKDTYFSCKGYDEEFVNHHYGDRCFMDFLIDNFNYSIWNQKFSNISYNRGGRSTAINDNVKITTYDDKEMVLHMPVGTHERIEKIKQLVVNRYNNKDFNQKQILNFPWRKAW